MGLKKLFKKKKKKPDYYSAIDTPNTYVPVQREAYFLVLNKYIDTGDFVLDVGFGQGYGMNIMSIKAGVVYGAEVDQKAYEYCSAYISGKNPKVEKLTVYDGITLPFEDKTFDIVTSCDVIEHVEDYRGFLRELLRVTKKGVFISTPNRRPEYTKDDGTPKNYWHLREWSYDECNEIIAPFGEIDWNCINGPFDGPFSITEQVSDTTMALSPFIRKKQS